MSLSSLNSAYSAKDVTDARLLMLLLPLHFLLISLSASSNSNPSFGSPSSSSPIFREPRETCRYGRMMGPSNGKVFRIQGLSLERNDDEEIEDERVDDSDDDNDVGGDLAASK